MGFLVTALTPTRAPSLLMCPTLSTRFTEPLSCGPFVSISRPFLHGSTAVTSTRAPCSPVLATLLYSPFAALGASSKVEAWDFSVSSLLRPCHLSSPSPSVADVFHEVETRKRSFQDTASLVAERGATFCSLVLEACGGERRGGPRLSGAS